MSERAWFDKVKSWTGGGTHGDPTWLNDIKFPTTDCGDERSHASFRCRRSSILATGCQTGGQARVVRLMLNTNSISWRLSVNGATNDTVIVGNDLTNVLTGLRLRHGDLILLGSLPNRQSGPVADTWTWLGRYCDSNRVAVYFYGVYDSTAAAEMFSVPVYHSVAPFDYPLKLESGSFFREGDFLGTGSAGFKKMLDEISRSRSKKIFVLGSLYDINRSLPPLASPGAIS